MNKQEINFVKASYESHRSEIIAEYLYDQKIQNNDKHIESDQFLAISNAESFNDKVITINFILEVRDKNMNNIFIDKTINNLKKLEGDLEYRDRVIRKE
ncbi:9534_t:CDS:2 [Funneliformis caledonium]|uniref:9534_t:CDS:1 n=1 Tax=Funneliformis caledonium TaxID=1117310 RepID=A0A9N9B3H6_9GLOM|nr:9534_t:CDS:2 [Funneliformis caledonium]